MKAGGTKEGDEGGAQSQHPIQVHLWSVGGRGAFEEDRQKSLAMGMNTHLSKPLQPEEMCAAIHAFVVKRAGNT